MKKKTFCPCREGTEPLGSLETPRHRRSPPLTLGAILLLIRMLEVHFAAMESVNGKQLLFRVDMDSPSGLPVSHLRILDRGLLDLSIA